MMRGDWASAVVALALATLVIRCTAFGTQGVAARDAEAPNVTDGGTFCPTRDASFCADFDEDPDAAAGWSAASAGISGVISETTTTFISPPRAFSARIGADGGTARLKWQYPPTAHRTALSFQVK